MKGPLSIRNHPLGEELRATKFGARQMVLFHRAEQRHQESSSGLDPSIQKLSIRREVVQLWEAPEGHYFYCLWFWMSDGSKYRVAFRISNHSESSLGLFERTEWPLKGKGTLRPGQSSKHPRSRYKKNAAE